jgi:hypothetical protein
MTMVGCVRILACCLAGLAVVTTAAAGEWQLAKDENGVRVYLSDVPGSKYKAYRGVTRIRTDMPTLRALQEDVAGSCAWIYACTEQRLLRHDGQESWTYTRFKMPWPVSARDSVLHVTTREEASGALIRILESAPDYLPKDRDYVRVQQVKGMWTFKPGSGYVEVVYELHTEPGGSVPSWLANSFVVDAPFNTLSGLRQRAEAR